MEQEKKKGPVVLGLAAFGLAAVLVLALAGGRRSAAVTASAVLEEPAQAAIGRTVIPLGKAVGIKLFSDGVLVVGLSPVETETGATCPGRDCGLKTGDVITHINGGEVDTIEEVQSLVAQSGDEPLTIRRCGASGSCS